MFVTLQDSGEESLIPLKPDEADCVEHSDKYHYMGMPCIILYDLTWRDCKQYLNVEFIHCMIVELFDGFTDDAFERWHRGNPKVDRMLRI